MQVKASLVASLVAMAIASGTSTANEVFIDASKLQATGAVKASQKQTGNYIVQLKGAPGITKAQELGELLPTNQAVAKSGNRYNAKSPKMAAYVKSLAAKQKKVAGDIGSLNIKHSFKHTFNGFTASLNAKQKALLESHPDVAGVWIDQVERVNTANTPEFLGLTGANGQHTTGVKGEDVIIGVIDTGIWPENPSFADDGSYSDPAALGWEGTCDTGTDEAFACNNKLIGARYFKDSFESQYAIQYELGEFESPRDADGHGSHTAGTAGGNEAVAATLEGVLAGTVSGIAPRARVAAYKVCWNSDYVNEAGQDEAGCFYGDSMAAIDQAVIDGVDVINFSIGGSRTDLTTPPAAAMLRASQAGVFVAVSAGNSGPDIETVGTPAPWVTSVAASTYDGTSTVIGNTLSVDGGESQLAMSAAFGPGGTFAGELALAEHVEGCNDNPITNDLTGKVALIARGSCAFTDKVINAQNAGAIGVVVYTYENTSPFNMGASDNADQVTIPSVMVSYDAGMALAANIGEGATNVAFTMDPMAGEATEVGNIMATFSSRGPNTASYDIIKPDITAPGVKILASTTSAPMFGAQGETYKYLQGTSMSSPHIAGLAALFKDSHSHWSPAEIKSALMTTAYQDVQKHDGSGLADPFNFGAGHANPVPAMDPGLLYDVTTADYLAFMCGLEEAELVASWGTSCEELQANGFSTDPSQLNLASIGVAELIAPETVTRTVKNATDVASTYTATVEAPAGVDVVVTTDSETGELVVDANGTASFALTFTKTEDAVVGEWAFGSITWTDAAGHSVRSPIAVKPEADIDIDVPESISGDLRRGGYRFPVQMMYSGRTSLDFAGLAAPFGVAGNVEADPGQSFEFLGAGTTYHMFTIPEGSKVARFSLRDEMVAVEGSDLDLYVYRCAAWRCSQVDASANGGSNEDVILVNPEAADDAANGDVYVTFIHGYSTGDQPATDYTMIGWVADQADSSTRMYSSRRAIKGRFNNVTIRTRGLVEDMVYMGGVTFYNAEGVAQGTTVLELKN